MIQRNVFLKSTVIFGYQQDWQNRNCDLTSLYFVCTAFNSTWRQERKKGDLSLTITLDSSFRYDAVCRNFILGYWSIFGILCPRIIWYLLVVLQIDCLVWGFIDFIQRGKTLINVLQREVILRSAILSIECILIQDCEKIYIAYSCSLYWKLFQKWYD